LERRSEVGAAITGGDDDGERVHNGGEQEPSGSLARDAVVLPVRRLSVPPSKAHRQARSSMNGSTACGVNPGANRLDPRVDSPGRRRPGRCLAVGVF
jgi:hypothetical protein